MKNLCVLALVFLAGRTLLACSDDGVYTPIEAPPAEEACLDKAGCPDAGTD